MLHPAISNINTFSLVCREHSPYLQHFRENALDYNSLGSALKLSRSDNFTYIVTELRRCCMGARYDECLMNRAAQAALLGHLLNPEEHLIVATALLAKVLR